MMSAAPGRAASRLLRSCVWAVVLSAVIGIGKPLLEHSVYLGRLLAMPAPTRLKHPLPDARARLHDSWHAPRSGGRRHEGVDIFAARGTPVRSTTEGIVLRRTGNRLGGKVVWMLGPAGHRHYYAHLDGFSHLRNGERIAAGTTLGYVGNTGNAKSTPPHLHYGIYTAKGPINPYPLLAQSRPGD